MRTLPRALGIRPRRPARFRAAPQACPLTPQIPSPQPVSWTSYGDENQLQNAAPGRCSLTRSSVKTLAPAWKAQLDGKIYASPLAFTVGARPLHLRRHRGRLGLRARCRRRQGRPADVHRHGCDHRLRQLGRDVDRRDLAFGSALLYVIGATGSLARAPSLDTGADVAGYPRQIVDYPEYEYVWGGLRIAARRLYVPVASYCDVGGHRTGVSPRVACLTIPLAICTGPLEGVGTRSPARRTWAVCGAGAECPVDPAAPARSSPPSATRTSGRRNAPCYLDDAGYGDDVVRPDARSLLRLSTRRIPASSPPATTTSAFDARPLPADRRSAASPPRTTRTARSHLGSAPPARTRADRLLIPVGDGVSAFIGTPAWSDERQTLTRRRQASARKAGSATAYRAFKRSRAAASSRPGDPPLGDGTQPTPLVVGRDTALRCRRDAGRLLRGSPTRQRGRSSGSTRRRAARSRR